MQQHRHGQTQLLVISDLANFKASPFPHLSLPQAKDLVAELMWVKRNSGIWGRDSETSVLEIRGLAIWFSPWRSQNCEFFAAKSKWIS